MRLILINPNTNSAMTGEMVAIGALACSGAQITGVTAPFGVGLITDPETLATSARAVAALAPTISDSDGVILAAFGDPGLEKLRDYLHCPVTGIAEAGMAEAAACGRRFAVVTTTPELTAQIEERAADYGHSNFAGTWLTPGDPTTTMADPAALVSALAEACARAVSEGDAEAIVIGGGPLAQAAQALRGNFPMPLVEPVPAAVRLAKARYIARTYS